MGGTIERGPPPPRGVMVHVYEMVVTPTKPEGEKASGDGREYLREAKSGTRFSIPMPPPGATATEVNRARLAGFRRKKLQIMQVEQGFESVNATKRFTAQLNQINRGSPTKPMNNTQQRALAAMRAREQRAIADAQAQYTKMAQIEKAKREREVVSSMERMAQLREQHVVSVMQLQTAEAIARGEVESKALAASAAMSDTEIMKARGAVGGEEEFEGE